MVSAAVILTLAAGGLVALLVLGYSVLFLQQLLLGLLLSLLAFGVTVVAGVTLSGE